MLYGAVVGGPDEGDKYYDIRDDWPETEARFSSTLFAAHDSLKPLRSPLSIATHPYSLLLRCTSWTIPPTHSIPH